MYQFDFNNLYSVLLENWGNYLTIFDTEDALWLPGLAV